LPILTVKEQITHRSVALRHLPVVDSNLRSLQTLPFGEAASVQIFDLASIGKYCLLFQIAHEAMDSARAYEVGEE
jgi:hypothetical protein